MKALDLSRGDLIVSTDGMQVYRVSKVRVLVSEGNMEITYWNTETNLATVIRCPNEIEFQVAH